MTVKRKRSNQGFSIVELLIVLGLFAILAFFLSYIGIFNFQAYNSQTAELTIASDARTALDDIDNYTRQANRVISSYSSYTTNSKTLILQIPSIDSSGQVINNTYDIVVFYLTGSDLFRRVFPAQGSSRLSSIKNLANGVDANSFSFSYDNADYSLVKEVTTSLTIVKNAGTQVKSITISSQSKLRNY